MKKSGILLSLIFILTLFSQTRIYPPLPADKITDMYFINKYKGIFINSGGGIFKTYDSGLTWEHVKTYSGEVFRKIKFIDENNGFILPQKPANKAVIGLVVTTNGGEDWRVENLSVTYSEDILPISTNVLLQCDWYGNILRLDNYFNQWDTVYQMPVFIIHDVEFGDRYESYGKFTSFELLPSGNILALGNYLNALGSEIIDDSVNVVLRSSDGGLSWEIIWSGLKSYIKKIQFITDEVGYMINNYDTLYYTNTGGVEWTNKGIPLNKPSIQDIFALSSDSLLILSSGNLHLSTDRGESWLTKSSDINLYGKLKFKNNKDGFVFGNILYKTSDLGLTWVNLNQRFQDNIKAIDFVNIEVGYAAGEQGFYKTFDGGKNWQRITSLPLDEYQYEIPPSSIAMLDENNGFVSRFIKGDLFKTNDGGESWETVILPGNPDRVESIHFFNDSLGMINTVTKIYSQDPEQSELFHYITRDRGETWDVIKVDSTSEAAFFDEIKFIKPNLLYAINRYGGLWKSKDTAKTWEQIYDPQNYFVGSFSFDFFNENFGVLGISYWDNLITTDGGLTWNMFSKVDGNHPKAFEILGKNSSNHIVAFEIGGGGKLFQYNFSSNGDVQFKRQLFTGTNLTLNCIETFYNGDNLHTWIVGDGFNLLYRDHQLEITSVEDKTTIFPSTFILYQNYPNPFNPTSRIKYQIGKTSKVELRVFDILGKVITTLVNEIKQPGYYEIEFDGGNFSSGVYFYQIISDEFVDTKKMVLLR